MAFFAVLVLTFATGARGVAGGNPINPAAPTSTPPGTPTATSIPTVTPSPTETSAATVPPSPTDAPSDRAPDDAVVSLAPFTDTIPFRTWAIEVAGGNASVDSLEVDDFGSAFHVTVEGQSARVVMTLTLPSDLELAAECFQLDSDVPVEILHPPRELILDVVQGGSYTCSYGTECVAPPAAGNAGVALYVATNAVELSRPWALSITGGRPLSAGCNQHPISSLALERDQEVPDWWFAAFDVDVMTPPARVEITAPAGARPSFGKAQCEDQVKDRFLDVLVPPRRLVFDVARFGYYVCYVEGHVASTAGTAPPTDTLRDVAHEESSGSGMFLAALAALAAFGASLLVGMRRRRWHRPGPYQIRQQP